MNRTEYIGPLLATRGAVAKPIEAERILSDTRSLAAPPLMGSAMRLSPLTHSLTTGRISLAVGELQIALLWTAGNIFEEVECEELQSSSAATSFWQSFCH